MSRLVECAGCDRVMEDEGYALCMSCEIHESDDCPACGGTTDNERSCTCSLNGPRPSSRQWQGHVR